MRRVRGRSIKVRPLAESPRLDCGDAPIDPYRGSLYTPEELYDATPYADSLDARAYAWSRVPPTPQATLAQALHDHAIDEALTRAHDTLAPMLEDSGDVSVAPFSALSRQGVADAAVWLRQATGVPGVEAGDPLRSEGEGN